MLSYLFESEQGVVLSLPVHIVAKKYAEYVSKYAGSVHSGLYHQEYYRSHRWAIENPDKVLEYVRLVEDIDVFLPYIRFYAIGMSGLDTFWKQGSYIVRDNYEKSTQNEGRIT